MSIFGRSQTVTGSTVTAPVYEGYGVEVNGDILAIQESWEDQLAVIEALHSLDMEELSLRGDVKTLQESSASETEIDARYEQYQTVTESMVKDAWEKIKEFFAKLWGKIKAFFKSVVRVFDGIFRSAESFVKKYKSDLKKLNLRDYKYKMFNYTHIDDDLGSLEEVKTMADELYAEATKASVSGYTEVALSNLDAKMTKMRENKEDMLDEIRGDVVDKGSLSVEQFAHELFAMFRGGAKSKEDKQEISVNIDTIITTIEKAGDGKKKADEFGKKVDAEFSRIIKDIDALAAKVKGTKAEGTHVDVDLGEGKGGKRKVKSDGVSKVVEALRVYSGIFSSTKSIQLQAFRAWQDAWKERNSTYKTVCTSAFRHKAEK
jgi:hypothetical protein